jgi:hypothetical protein
MTFEEALAKLNTEERVMWERWIKAMNKSKGFRPSVSALVCFVLCKQKLPGKPVGGVGYLELLTSLVEGTPKAEMIKTPSDTVFIPLFTSPLLFAIEIMELDILPPLDSIILLLIENTPREAFSRYSEDARTSILASAWMGASNISAKAFSKIIEKTDNIDVLTKTMGFKEISDKGMEEVNHNWRKGDWKKVEKPLTARIKAVRPQKSFFENLKFWKKAPPVQDVATQPERERSGSEASTGSKASLNPVTARALKAKAQPSSATTDIADQDQDLEKPPECQPQ